MPWSLTKPNFLYKLNTPYVWNFKLAETHFEWQRNMDYPPTTSLNLKFSKLLTEIS